MLISTFTHVNQRTHYCSFKTLLKLESLNRVFLQGSRSSPLHGAVQQVEEGLQYHVVPRLVGVVELGGVEGDGGSRRVPHALGRRAEQSRAEQEKEKERDLDAGQSDRSGTIH